ELTEGQPAWIKLPYGDFVIDGGADVALFAGGTGVTACTAFLEALPADMPHRVTLAYGARTSDLLIYRDVVERSAARLASLQVVDFVADDAGATTAAMHHRGG